MSPESPSNGLFRQLRKLRRERKQDRFDEITSSAHAVETVVETAERIGLRNDAIDAAASDALETVIRKEIDALSPGRARQLPPPGGMRKPAERHLAEERPQLGPGLPQPDGVKDEPLS